MTVQPSLGTIRIASPCSADWDSMAGDERKRFCAHCERHVYNLSAMTKREADRLLLTTDGQICTRLYRRADGTVLTEDCPIGWNAMKKKVSRVAGAALSTALTFYGNAFAQNPAPPQTQEFESFRSVSGVVQDVTGGALPNARVRLVHVASGQELSSNADERGAFHIPHMEFGAYRLTVEADGFHIFTKDNVVVERNAPVELNVVLQVGPATMGGPVYATPMKHSRLHKLLH